MKKIIAACLSVLVGAFGYTLVETSIDTRVSNLEAECSSLQGVVSSLAELHERDGVIQIPDAYMTTNPNPTITMPTIIMPTDKEPAITEPAITEPAITEPAITEPAITEPASTKPSVATTTKPTTNPDMGGGNTVQTNPDGSKDIVKPDGSIALSYSYSAADDYFYVDDSSWEENFAFNRLYDMDAVYTVMYLDTFHVYYNHGGYDRMIQFWKGQYGLLFLGGEIGLYYKDPSGTTSHYNCADEDMEIFMQMTVYREGYGELFTRPYASHWWTTAFVPDKLKKFNDRTELTMVAKLTFKTEEERAKFCEGLEKVTDIDGNRFRYVTNISKNNSEQYTYNDTTGDLVWRYLDEERVTPLKTTTIAP
ncbi:MAG: DUF4474 domain-containing protein [Clostridia bacterium]|nr:DUF4474 domain-containing protein [Clostridia bacterium]